MIERIWKGYMYIVSAAFTGLFLVYIIFGGNFKFHFGDEYAGISFKKKGYDTVMAHMEIKRGGYREHRPVFLVAEDGEVVQYLDYWGRPFIVSKHDKVEISRLQEPDGPHKIVYLRLPITPYYTDTSMNVAKIWYRLAIGVEDQKAEDIKTK